MLHKITLQTLNLLATIAALGFVAARTLAADDAAAATLASSTPDSIEARRALFAYDRTAGFGLEEKRVEIRGGAQIRDVSFLATPGANGRVAAYLVRPREQPVRAAILWVHWLGEPATTNRTEFLDEAVALAGRGVVSLLVDTMWAKPRWYRDRVLDDDYKNSVVQVIALRRAMDLLAQQPGAAPLAIVGHDYGGMYATIAAGLEPRAKTCVFIACTASLRDWAFFQKQPAAMEAYLRENRPLELCDYLATLQGASLLFQCAEHDQYVPLVKAQEFFAAAPPTKQMIVYGGAEHSMSSPANIRLDRTAWLARELGLDRD